MISNPFCPVKGKMEYKAKKTGKLKSNRYMFILCIVLKFFFSHFLSGDFEYQVNEAVLKCKLLNRMAVPRYCNGKLDKKITLFILVLFENSQFRSAGFPPSREFQLAGGKLKRSCGCKLL